MANDKMKKFLIAGGAGFIGSRVANKLAASGYQTVVMDNLSDGKRSNLNSRVKFYLADIRNEDLMQKIFNQEKPDIVINQAAKVYWDEKEKDQILDISVSVLGTINLLNNCVKYKVKKFIFASTISVYGRQSGKKSIKESEIINYNDIPASIFSYAAAKNTAERYVYNHSKQFKLDYAILRYAHVYGSGKTKQRDVVSIFIENIINNKPLLITGDGKQYRDYVYIEDAVEATLAALKFGSNGIYNIGGGAPVTVNSLIKTLKKIFKKNIKVKNIKSAEKSDGRYMNIVKAKRELRWFPKISLEEGLKKTIQSYLNN